MKTSKVAQTVKWHGFKKKQDLMVEENIVQTVVR
jgi:hypothetical protein